MTRRASPITTRISRRWTAVSAKSGRCSRSMASRTNTLFIYTTDQGSEWPHSKWTLYDAGLHVPFLAVWPGVTKPAIVCDALISLIDVTPTFIDIAGGEAATGPGWQELPGRAGR